MRTCCLAALACVIIIVSVSGNSFRDDSRYIPLGPRTGYYIVRPGSVLSHQLGLEGAPTRDTADPFNHGYGAHALAFRFNNAGILSAPPAYIVQATPNDFYIRRIRSFIRGHTTSHDVKGFFGRPTRIESGPHGIITYYTIEVYNPFESRGGRR
jgi:hypothetical protein